jgi:hypothetical protein
VVELLGVVDGTEVGVFDRVTDGDDVGVDDGTDVVGDAEGVVVGGFDVGVDVGAVEGLTVGDIDGDDVGVDVGTDTVGDWEGGVVGEFDVGVDVGLDDGVVVATRIPVKRAIATCAAQLRSSTGPTYTTSWYTDVRLRGSTDSGNGTDTVKSVAVDASSVNVSAATVSNTPSTVGAILNCTRIPNSRSSVRLYDTEKL